MDAFFHPKGTEQAKEHSEYELSFTYKNDDQLIAVHNAIVFRNKVFQVINEDEPVYFIAHIYLAHEAIFMLKQHMGKNNEHSKPAKVNCQIIKSTEIGAILTQELSSQKICIGIRRDKEEYFIGNPPESDNPLSIISYQDLLEFVAKKINWENLKGRSYLFGQAKKKELSIQEKLAQSMATVRLEKRQNDQSQKKIDLLEKQIKVIQNNSDQYIVEIRELQSLSASQVVRIVAETQRADDAEASLANIPYWIIRLFTWVKN